MSVCSKFEKQNADDLKPDLCEDDQHTVIQVQNIHISQCTLESRAHLRSVRKIRLMSPRGDGFAQSTEDRFCM